MIEFCGYLSGEALNHFRNKSRELGYKIIFFTLLTFLPLIVFLIVRFNSFSILGYYCLGAAIISLAMFMPKTKKEQKKLVPKKIFTENDCIICVGDTYTESKFIEDVKKIVDYGEFYDITFRLGNLSDKYVCQKNLLVKGTIDDFEALFKGKIVRKTVDSSSSSNGNIGDGTMC